MYVIKISLFLLFESVIFTALVTTFSQCYSLCYDFQGLFLIHFGSLVMQSKPKQYSVAWDKLNIQNKKYWKVERPHEKISTTEIASYKK